MRFFGCLFFAACFVVRVSASNISPWWPFFCKRHAKNIQLQLHTSPKMDKVWWSSLRLEPPVICGIQCFPSRRSSPVWAFFCPRDKSWTAMNIQLEWDGSRLTPHFAAKASEKPSRSSIQRWLASSGRRQVSTPPWSLQVPPALSPSSGGHTKDLPLCLQHPSLLLKVNSRCLTGGRIETRNLVTVRLLMAGSHVRRGGCSNYPHQHRVVCHFSWGKWRIRALVLLGNLQKSYQ